MNRHQSQSGVALVTYAIALSLLLVVFLAISQFLQEGIKEKATQSHNATGKTEHCLPGIPEGDERCL